MVAGILEFSRFLLMACKNILLKASSISRKRPRAWFVADESCQSNAVKNISPVIIGP